MDVISLPVCKEVLEFGSGQKESSAQKPSLVFQLRNFAEVLFLLRNKSRKMVSSLHLMGFYPLMEHCGQRPPNCGFMRMLQEPYLLNLKAVALENSLCITKCQGHDLVTA